MSIAVVDARKPFNYDQCQHGQRLRIPLSVYSTTCACISAAVARVQRLSPYVSRARAALWTRVSVNIPLAPAWVFIISCAKSGCGCMWACLLPLAPATHARWRMLVSVNIFSSIGAATVDVHERVYFHLCQHGRSGCGRP